MPVTAPRDEGNHDQMSEDLQREVLKHPGKWIAATQSEVIAIADDAKTAFEQARSKGFDLPIVFKVASSDRTAYFF